MGGRRIYEIQDYSSAPKRPNLIELSIFLGEGGREEKGEGIRLPLPQL